MTLHSSTQATKNIRKEITGLDGRTRLQLQLFQQGSRVVSIKVNVTIWKWELYLEKKRPYEIKQEPKPGFAKVPQTSNQPSSDSSLTV